MIDFLTGIIDWINGGIGLYAISLILFTLAIRVIVLPLDIKSRKGMRKMAKIQPKIAELQAKYANDQVKLQKKQQELMQKEHYNPLSGCLPMLLQYPILLIMFYAMRSVANREMARQVLEAIGGDGYPINPSDTFLWIKNMWVADSFFSSVAPSVSQLGTIPKESWIAAMARMTPDQIMSLYQNLNLIVPDQISAESWVKAAQNIVTPEALALFENGSWKDALALISSTDIQAILPALGVNTLDFTNALSSCQTTLSAAYQASNFFVTYNTPSATLSVVNTWLGNIYWPCNGYMILAIASVISQIFMTKINPTDAAAQQPAPAAKDKQQSSQSMTKFMKYFFPAFSFYCCVSSYAAFALYWVASNLFMITITVFINKYLDKKEAAEADKETIISGEGNIK